MNELLYIRISSIFSLYNFWEWVRSSISFRSIRKNSSLLKLDSTKIKNSNKHINLSLLFSFRSISEITSPPSDMPIRTILSSFELFLNYNRIKCSLKIFGVLLTINQKFFKKGCSNWQSNKYSQTSWIFLTLIFFSNHFKFCLRESRKCYKSENTNWSSTNTFLNFAKKVSLLISILQVISGRLYRIFFQETFINWFG